MNSSRNRITIWVAIGVGLLGTIYLVTHPGFSKSKKLPFGIVERKDLIQRVTVAGNIIPARKSVISAPYNAYIKKIHVKLGEKVPEGAPLVSFVQSLRGIAEESFPMRAPFSGQVVQVLRTDGEYVETGKDASPVLRMDDLSRLYVVADVPENDIEKIRVGLETVIKASAITERSYPGKIVDIALAAKDKKEWTRPGERVEFTIKIEILNPDAQLHPGMSTIIDIITAKQENVLTLPQEYFQRENSDYFVTGEHGARKKVSIGTRNDELFEIVDGVKEGERVKLVDFLSATGAG